MKVYENLHMQLYEIGPFTPKFSGRHPLFQKYLEYSSILPLWKFDFFSQDFQMS